MGSVKRNIDSVIAELEALEEVGVIDEQAYRKAKAYVDNHEDEVEEMLGTESKLSEIADLVVNLSRSGSGNPAGYRKAESDQPSKENDMATKKGKGKKAKGKVAKRAARKGGGEVRNRDTVANFIRAELESAGKDYDAKKIAEKAAKNYPDKKPTPGYVNWIKEHAPKASTTTVAA